MSLSELPQAELPQAALRPLALSRQSRYLALVFTSTIFLSAFLLFGVQPMFTKMILPWLGGSPAVWSVAMVFFQGLLLLGYLYAHLSTTYLRPRAAVTVHGMLAAAAFLTLPLTVSQAFGTPPDSGQGLWLLAVFAGSVGLPFFVLSASAPLLQAWFARSGHERAANPYFLYAASNGGSFAALIAYPLLIEPLAALQTQRFGWMWMFAALGVALVVCGISARCLAAGNDKAETQDLSAPAPLTWRQRAVWIGLASIPSGLLVAVTAHLSTDVASAPLLWVLPLALFMLTFILAFRETMFAADQTLSSWFARLTPFVIMSVVGFIMPLGVQFAIHLGVLFLAAMICHRRLYLGRPHPAQLTEFYLWMSFGGLIGGLFAGLLAPYLFSTIIEYRLLLIAALLCVTTAGVVPSYRKQLLFAGFSVLAGVAFMIAAPLMATVATKLPYALGLAMATAFMAIIILNRHGPLASAGAAAGAFLALAITTGDNREMVVRSFFGVNYVKTGVSGNTRILSHGSTVHGAVRIRDLDGKPVQGRPQATTYYHDEGGINLALRAARQNAGGTIGRVAVLGLGAGAMACQSAEGESWTYFEIDSEVAKLAQRAEVFPFLSRCTPGARIVIGDARLTLQKETARYDVIILDAFSSDAVPAHLLTLEAFRIYADMLNPGGMIIAHVSNRHMDLRSVAEAAAKATGMASLSARIDIDPEAEKSLMQLATPTIVVAMSPDTAALENLRMSNARWRAPSADAGSALWTDDYANIMGAMIREFWRPSSEY
jgi:spermidine synthase